MRSTNNSVRFSSVLVIFRLMFAVCSVFTAYQPTPNSAAESGTSTAKTTVRRVTLKGKAKWNRRKKSLFRSLQPHKLRCLSWRPVTQIGTLPRLNRVGTERQQDEFPAPHVKV